MHAPGHGTGRLWALSGKTERSIQLIERYCKLLVENLAAHQEWRRLIVAHSVKGVETHDARLVAIMKAHGVTHLLTMNVDDFKRYSGIVIVSPATLFTP